MINKIIFLPRAKLVLGGLMLVLAGCGSAPPRPPIAVEQAAKADFEAHRALRDGDLVRAREQFRQTKLMQQALDNQAATAMAAINLSSVSHKLGDSTVALDLLDAVLLPEKAGLIPGDLRLAALFRKAIILADTGKDDAAQAATAQAGQECAKQCAYSAGIDNLGARLALNRGDYLTALAMAMGVVGKGADKEELANARRIAAAAQLALAQNEAALANYQAALVLDKELALSSRIAEDLRGVARALEKLGRQQEAEVYLRRAEAVTTATGMLPSKAAGRASH